MLGGVAYPPKRWFAYAEMGSGRFGRRRLELRELDPCEQPTRLPCLEPAGAQLERRGGGRGDRCAEGVVERLAVELRGEEGRDQGVPGPDRRDLLEPGGGDAEPPGRAVGAQAREAAVDARDEHVAGPLLRDRVEAEHEVLVVAE